MKAETTLTNNGFSCYLAHSGTKYYTGYIGNREVTVRISDHAPNSAFISSEGSVKYRDEPDYRIDPEQDDSEKINAIFKKPYQTFLTYEEDAPNGKVIRWVGKSEKSESEIKNEFQEFNNVTFISRKEYFAEKKKCVNGKFYLMEATE